MIENINIRVNKNISEYLGFDIDPIFKRTNYCEIFGGAIRDSLSGCKINDVDFLCLRESSFVLEEFLIKNGYSKIDKICGREIQEMYRNIHCIFEPITYMNSQFKIVQIIIPALSNCIKIENNKFISSVRFMKLLREVDLSCCGLSYNGKIRENVSNAIIHCLCKVYRREKQSEMYHPERTEIRVSKLESKGWIDIDFITTERKELFDRYLKILNRSRKLLKV